MAPSMCISIFMAAAMGEVVPIQHAMATPNWATIASTAKLCSGAICFLIQRIPPFTAGRPETQEYGR